MDGEIILKTYELVDEINETEIFKEYKILKEKLNNDIEKNLLSNFNIAKQKVEELQGGKFHPDYKKYINLFIEAKVLMLDNDTIKTFFKVESEVTSLLNDISRKIGNAISRDIKVPNELGILSKCKKK